MTAIPSARCELTVYGPQAERVRALMEGPASLDGVRDWLQTLGVGGALSTAVGWIVHTIGKRRDRRYDKEEKANDARYTFQVEMLDHSRGLVERLMTEVAAKDRVIETLQADLRDLRRSRDERLDKLLGQLEEIHGDRLELTRRIGELEAKPR